MFQANSTSSFRQPLPGEQKICLVWQQIPMWQIDRLVSLTALHEPHPVTLGCRIYCPVLQVHVQSWNTSHPISHSFHPLHEFLYKLRCCQNFRRPLKLMTFSCLFPREPHTEKHTTASETNFWMMCLWCSSLTTACHRRHLADTKFIFFIIFFIFSWSRSPPNKRMAFRENFLLDEGLTWPMCKCNSTDPILSGSTTLYFRLCLSFHEIVGSPAHLNKLRTHKSFSVCQTRMPQCTCMDGPFCPHCAGARAEGKVNSQNWLVVSGLFENIRHGRFQISQRICQIQ